MTNYTELKAAIARWLKRGDLTDAIPDFITMAEARLSRNLRVRQMEKSATVYPSERLAKLPTDWIELIGQPMVDGHPANYLTRDQMKAVTHGDFYALRGGNIEILSADAQEVAIDYYARIPALTDLKPTNWLLTDAPDIYLYAALLESAPYLKNDARIEVWKAFLERSVSDLQTQSDNAKYSGGSLEIR